MITFLTKFRAAIYDNRSDAYKSAINTALWVFISSFLGALTGFLDDLNNWVQGDNKQILDDLTVFGKATFSALVSSWVALLQYGVRFGQSKGKIPGQGPVYPEKLNNQNKAIDPNDF